MIVAVPNLLFYRTRAKLLLGKFEYTEDGIMDSTHFRWYTLTTLSRVLEHHGLSVDFAYGEGSAPLGPLRRICPSVCARIDRLAGAAFPGLFGYQLVCIARANDRCEASARLAAQPRPMRPPSESK